MHITKAQSIFNNVSGSSFVGIDTETEVKLKGGKSNPHLGRVKKIVTGSSVMVFQNKRINGYEAMVQRRLVAEGKNPASFELQPRKWGQRIEDSPFVEHVKDGETHYYLEVIFLKAGDVHYELDGKPIAKDDIIGMPEDKPAGGQGGLDDKVIIRSYKLSSIRKVRIDGTEYTC